MAVTPQMCNDSGLTILQCECDDCTSLKLDIIAEVLGERNDVMNTEILSQIDTFKEMFSDYYTKSETNEVINASRGVGLVVVDELPNDPVENTMYFVRLSDEEVKNLNRRFARFIFVDNGWEILNDGDDYASLYYAIKYTGYNNAERIMTYNSGNTNAFPEYNDLFNPLDGGFTFNGWKYSGETTTNAPGTTIDLSKAQNGITADISEE